MIAALARPPIARITRRPGIWLALAGWAAVAVAFAVVAHRRALAHGADHVLLDAYGAFILPLVAYLVVGATVASQSLRSSIAPLVTFGAAPARAAAAAVAVGGVASAVLCAAIGAAIAAVAHGSADPPRLHDALVSAYAGALGGAAYAAWFALGASFGRRGGGRALFLVLDWILGAASGASAVVVPRGHVRNLLGGAPPMDLTQRASATALVAIAVLATLVAVRRARR